MGIHEKRELGLDPLHVKILQTLRTCGFWSHIKLRSTKLRPTCGQGRAGDVQQGTGGEDRAWGTSAQPQVHPPAQLCCPKVAPELGP